MKLTLWDPSLLLFRMLGLLTLYNGLLLFVDFFIGQFVWPVPWELGHAFPYIQHFIVPILVVQDGHALPGEVIIWLNLGLPSEWWPSLFLFVGLESFMRVHMMQTLPSTQWITYPRVFREPSSKVLFIELLYSGSGIFISLAPLPIKFWHLLGFPLL